MNIGLLGYATLKMVGILLILPLMAGGYYLTGRGLLDGHITLEDVVAGLFGFVFISVAGLVFLVAIATL